MAEALLIDIFISVAVSAVMNLLFRQEPDRQSPTYSDQLATTISNTVVIPLAYGTVKVAGNMIWQKLSDDKKWCYKMICFGDGPIKDISDIRLNDLSIDGVASPFFIWNTLYSNATVAVSGNVLYLNSSGGNRTINMKDLEWDSIGSGVWSFGGGWEYSKSGLNIESGTCSNMTATACYNNPVAIKLVSSETKLNGDAGYRKYMGSGSQAIDDIVPGATQTDKAKVVGSLQHDAYLAVWAKATDQLNGDFNTTVVMQGRLVRIYTSTSTYYTAWSDNPAWCILDFLTCYNGVGLEHANIDIQSFINAAEYCDGLVSNPDGTKQKRYTLNFILDEKKSRLDWLADMMRTCSAYPTYQNGKYGMMMECAQTVSQYFNSNNTNDVEVWWSSMDEIVDVLRIKYIEPTYDWAKVMASAEAEEYLRDQPFIHEIDIYGVTNFSQASRLAWFYLNQSVTCTTWIKFKTDRRAIARSIGDIISISDYVLEYEDKKFRIMQMSEAQDDKIEVTCREYNPLIYTDTFGSVKPTVNVSTLPNPLAKPQAPMGIGLTQTYYIQADKRNVVAYITASLSYNEGEYFKQFRYWISDNNGLTWKFVKATVDSEVEISGVEIGKTYIIKACTENTNGVLSDGTLSPPIYFSGNNLAPSPVTDLKAIETVGGFSISWSPNKEPDLDFYSIYVLNNGVSTFLANVSGSSYFYSATSGNYTFTVRAVDTANNSSEGRTCQANVSIPSQVQGFDAYQNGMNIDFVWEQNIGESVSYEIRRGQTWDLGEVVARVNGGFAKLSFAPPGSHLFWIKSKSMYGVYCVNATWSNIDIAPVSNRNAIFKINPEYVWDGVKFNTDVISGGLQLRPNCIRGEYIQEVNLPFSCTARNWIDSSIIAVIADGISWGSADFSWESVRSNTPWLQGGTHAQDLALKHQIAIKTTIPSTIVESFPLDNSVVGEKGTAVTRADKVTYTYGRFKDGAIIKDNTFLRWDTVNIPSTFSMSFTFKIGTGMVGDVGYLTLKNASGKWLFVGYCQHDDMFYLSGSDGKIIKMNLDFATQDFITLGISQSASVRRILGYSLSTGNKVSEEISASSLGVFTSMSLYANI